MGYSHVFGPDIAPDGPTPERANYRQVLLTGRLRAAIDRLNPGIPTAAREDALKQVVDLGIPVLLSANRQFHRLLVAGVPVQYQLNGETRGDLNADVWKAFDQIQTYKEQIPDVFQTNEMLVISDGTEALLGSLSADPERFMAWRTIDGSSLDPLGEFNELQTLVRGVLAPVYLLDYLRYFVLFEDDGGLIKKIAGYHQFHAVRLAIGKVVAASRPGGSQKGGVVWHTQGSGKSCGTCWRIGLRAALCLPRSRSSCPGKTKTCSRCCPSGTTSS